MMKIITRRLVCLICIRFRRIHHPQTHHSRNRVHWLLRLIVSKRDWIMKVKNRERSSKFDRKLHSGFFLLSLSLSGFIALPLIRLLTRQESNLLEWLQVFISRISRRNWERERESEKERDIACGCLCQKAWDCSRHFISKPERSESFVCCRRNDCSLIGGGRKWVGVLDDGWWIGRVVRGRKYTSHKT